MFSHHLGRALAIASALLLTACRTFSPDGGMGTVAAVAGGGLNKNVVRISSRGRCAGAKRGDAAAARAAQRRRRGADRAPQQSRTPGRL